MTAPMAAMEDPLSDRLSVLLADFTRAYNEAVPGAVTHPPSYYISPVTHTVVEAAQIIPTLSWQQALSDTNDDTGDDASRPVRNLPAVDPGDLSDLWTPCTFLDDIDPGCARMPSHDDFRSALKSALAPLAGVCTHALLHEARLHAHGPEYGSMRAEDDACALLSVDRALHVPADTPQTTWFEGHIRRFVSLLVERLWWLYPPATVHRMLVPGMDPTEHRPPRYSGYDLRPMGSFPCDCKVGDIDEFDYICELVVTDAWVREKGGMLSSALQREVPKYVYVADMLNILLSDGTSSPELRITNLYHHGPAICIEFTWTCTQTTCNNNTTDTNEGALYTKEGASDTKEGASDTKEGASDTKKGASDTNEGPSDTRDGDHQHSVSVDITWAFRADDPRLDRKLEARMLALPTPFHGVLSHSPRRHLFPCMPSQESPYTSVPYDSPLFESVEGILTEDVRSLFRCLKTLSSRIYPHNVTGEVKQCMTHDIMATEGGQGLVGRHCSGILSSHALKCLLFEEIKTRPDPGDWTKARLVDRAAAILQRLLYDNSTAEDPSCWFICEDIITGGGMCHRLPGSVLSKVRDATDMMLDLLHGRGHRRTPIDNPDHPSATLPHLVTLHGVLCQAVISEDLTFENVDVHTLGSIVKMCFYTLPTPSDCQPLLQGCRDIVSSLYRAASETVDLTVLPMGDHAPGWYRGRSRLHYIWGLLYTGAITSADLVGGGYGRKVDTLKMIMDRLPDEGRMFLLPSLDPWVFYLIGSAQLAGHVDVWGELDGYLVRADEETIYKLLVGDKEACDHYLRFITSTTKDAGGTFTGTFNNATFYPPVVSMVISHVIRNDVQVDRGKMESLQETLGISPDIGALARYL